jgi:uncharacterized hydrophobic protein (TIGR00271 family)
VVHLRIVSPKDLTERALAVLMGTASVCNVVVLRDAARRPEGDLILCDVAREDTSVVVSDLKEIGIHRDGSIALEVIDTQVSDAADRAEVEERSSESVELSGVFLLFIVLAALIAAVGIYLDSPILIVGAMVVGPEFGPIAGFCVAVVQRQRALAWRSFVALAVGFPLAIAGTFVATVVFTATGITPAEFSSADHGLSNVIASPDFLAVFVAVCAGTAGMLSLSTAKSGALIGVLISVTTIPAAANIGVSAAYGDWAAWRGSMGQLAINLGAVLVSGTLTLAIQRRSYQRRRRRHLASLADDGGGGRDVAPLRSVTAERRVR